MSKRIVDVFVKNLREAGYEVDVQKCHTISNAICTTLFILSIFDILKYGFKEHMKRAYSCPIQQLGLGVLIEVLVIMACTTKIKK